MCMRKIAVLMAVGLVYSPGARADPAVDPKALAKAQFMLRQVAGELDAAKTENAALKTELASLKAKKSGVEGALAKSTGRVEELQARLDEALAAKQKTEETAADRGRQLDQCSGKNAKLYDLNSELLRRYADKGLVDVLTHREPLIGLKKVEMENLVQDLQDKLDEQHLSADQDARPASEHLP